MSRYVIDKKGLGENIELIKEMANGEVIGVVRATDTALALRNLPLL